MDKTIVGCSMPACGAPAVFKVAAPWADGRFAELKTYGFACPAHLEAIAAEARDRRKAYPNSPGETVGELGVYRYRKGELDSRLERVGG